MYFILLFLTLLIFLYSYKNIKNICNNKYSYYQSKFDNDKNYIIKADNDISHKNVKNSSFYLPGLLDVFPELKIGFSKHELKFKKCIKDADCEKPEMCCDNPFKKNDKFCCNGAFVGKRVPEYAF